MISAALAPCASAECDVMADAGSVQVRRGGVDRELDQRLDLRRERAVAPRVRGQGEVALEEAGVDLEEGAPLLVPGAVRRDPFLAQARALARGVVAHESCAAAESTASARRKASIAAGTPQ